MTPAKILEGLTGKARRDVYLRLKENERLERRADRRLPTRHALVIRELIRAQLLPAPGPDLAPEERRKIRNKLKATRRGQR